MSTTFLDFLHSLRVLLVALLHFIGIKGIMGAFGVFLMGFGIYTICTSFASFNIIKSELGTVLFFLGANILAWSCER